MRLVDFLPTCLSKGEGLITLPGTCSRVRARVQSGLSPAAVCVQPPRPQRRPPPPRRPPACGSLPRPRARAPRQGSSARRRLANTGGLWNTRRPGRREGGWNAGEREGGIQEGRRVEYRRESGIHRGEVGIQKGMETGGAGGLNTGGGRVEYRWGVNSTRRRLGAGRVRYGGVPRGGCTRAARRVRYVWVPRDGWAPYMTFSHTQALC